MVEGLIGFIRRNSLVPVPHAESFEALRVGLEKQCFSRLSNRLSRYAETISERLARDREAFVPLPTSLYDACDRRHGRVRSLSLVRYHNNDYSVPTACGHREVLIRGYVDEMFIGCGSEVIARHRRSYGRENLIFDPLHYQPPIEKKIGALDQATARAGCDLPETFVTQRRLMEVRLGKAGKREHVQVLRLLVTFQQVDVEVRSAMLCGRARSASMRSSTWCCGGSNGDRRASTSTSIPICPEHGSRQRRLRAT